MLGTEEREVLNTEQAAQLLGVSSRTLRAMAAAEEVPARRMGRNWRFSRTALLDWLGQRS
jgi:excisionase family DNA binding protein